MVLLKSPQEEIMTENTNTKKTFAERAAAEPTELHKRFAEWLKAETGVDVDLKTVQLVTTLRMDFQKSDDNQTALAERKAKAAEEAAKKTAARKAKLEAELAKLNGETVEEAPKAETAPPAPIKADEAPVVEDAPKPAPRKRVRRTAAK